MPKASASKLVLAILAIEPPRTMVLGLTIIIKPNPLHSLASDHDASEYIEMDKAQVDENLLILTWGLLKKFFACYNPVKKILLKS